MQENIAKVYQTILFDMHIEQGTYIILDNKQMDNSTPS